MRQTHGEHCYCLHSGGLELMGSGRFYLSLGTESAVLDVRDGLKMNRGGFFPSAGTWWWEPGEGER